MIFSTSREHFATWIGVVGVLLLLAAGWAAFEADYFGGLILGVAGGVLELLAVVLLRSQK